MSTPSGPRHEGWNVPKPDVIPRPTFWPAGLAVGITFLLWGIVSSLVIVAMGATVTVYALAGWLKELRNEERSP